MTKDLGNVIVKEFLDTIAALLEYEPCEASLRMERSVLELLCKAKKAPDLSEECLSLIESARPLQTRSDSALLFSSENETDVVLDIKAEALEKYRVNKLKKLDMRIFTEHLKDDADIGKPEACRLLACLDWLGEGVVQNKKAALKMWSYIFTNGDRSAAELLIYACRDMGQADEAEKWTHILDILTREYEAFSSVALCSCYREYTENEVQLANIIMFITQRNAEQGTSRLDKSMLGYALESKEDYKTKMNRLSASINYSYALYAEDRYQRSRLGF